MATTLPVLVVRAIHRAAAIHPVLAKMKKKKKIKVRISVIQSNKAGDEKWVINGVVILHSEKNHVLCVLSMWFHCCFFHGNEKSIVHKQAPLSQLVRYSYITNFIIHLMSRFISYLSPVRFFIFWVHLSFVFRNFFTLILSK